MGTGAYEWWDDSVARFCRMNAVEGKAGKSRESIKPMDEVESWERRWTHEESLRIVKMYVGLWI